METIKRGTALNKQFRLVGVDPENTIESIEFLFKSRLSENAPALLHKMHPGDETTYDQKTNICTVYFSEIDTRLLKAFENVYMDTRITYADGVIPETVIKKFEIHETLFGKEATYGH